MAVGVGLGWFGITMVAVSVTLGCHCAEAQSAVPPANHPYFCEGPALPGGVPSGSCGAFDTPLWRAALPSAGTVPAPGKVVEFATLTPGHFQSFVKTWQKPAAPLCQVLRSNADWERWMGAAAVMGQHKPYAPPESLWSHHFVVLIARVVGAQDPDTVFDVTGVRADREALDIAYHVNRPSTAPYKIAAWVGVVLRNDQRRGRLDIIEDGAMTCSVDDHDKGASLMAPPNARPQPL
jgi:hypothetical protein